MRGMRKINAGKLSKILEEHKRWLDTDKKEGKRADLSNANLSGANLSNANLTCADLSDANLYEADLWYADLFEVFGLNIEQLPSPMPSRDVPP